MRILNRFTGFLRIIYNGIKGRKAAHQFAMRPKAANWLIIVYRGLYTVFGKHPEFGEFTLVLA